MAMTSRQEFVYFTQAQAHVETAPDELKQEQLIDSPNQARISALLDALKNANAVADRALLAYGYVCQAFHQIRTRLSLWILKRYTEYILIILYDCCNKKC